VFGTRFNINIFFFFFLIKDSPVYFNSNRRGKIVKFNFGSDFAFEKLKKDVPTTFLPNFLLIYKQSCPF